MLESYSIERRRAMLRVIIQSNLKGECWRDSYKLIYYSFYVLNSFVTYKFLIIILKSNKIEKVVLYYIDFLNIL
jgi:hypothetical protein